MTAEIILFPHTAGGFAPCRGCWQHKPTARTVDPRDGGIKPLCAGCARALVHGEQLPPLTDAAWDEIARLHQNKEIDDETVDEAIHYGSPLKLTPGWDAFEALKDALLRLQKAEDPSTVLDAELIGPDHTPETYVNDCHALITGARARLTGAQK